MDAPLWTETEQSPSFKLTPPIELEASPGGEPFVWFSKGDPVQVNEVVRRVGGYALVSIFRRINVRTYFKGGPNIEIQGWVPARALQAAEFEHCGGAPRLIGGIAFARVLGIPLPVSTHLYDRPDGRIVGIVTKPDLRFIPIAKTNGWTAVSVPHRLGRQTLWVRKR
jgi:hypothetical protein